MQFEAKVLSNVLWAIGNLVQLGKGSSMIIQDANEVQANNTFVNPSSSGGGGGSAPNSVRNNVNNLFFNSSSTPANNNAPETPDGLAGTDSPSFPLLGGLDGLKNAFSSSPMNASQPPVGGGAPSSTTTTKGGGMFFQTKGVKNTTRFLNTHISEKLKKLIFQYIEYPEMMLWSCRAINNLAKSQRLKLSLLDNNILDALLGVLQKYSKNQDIMEWGNLAKETLTNKE
jgi:hypothetical protein